MQLSFLTKLFCSAREIWPRGIQTIGQWTPERRPTYISGWPCEVSRSLYSVREVRNFALVIDIDVVF